MRRLLAAPILLYLVAALSGCTLFKVPTSADPTCSWTSAVPSNDQQVCAKTFATLAAVAKAEIRDDRASLRRLVVNARVRGAIEQHGRQMRAKKVYDWHVIPSLAMEQIKPGYVGAGFFLAGKAPGGKVVPQEQVFLRLINGRYVIVNDQASEEW